MRVIGFLLVARPTVAGIFAIGALELGAQMAIGLDVRHGHSNTVAAIGIRMVPGAFLIWALWRWIATMYDMLFGAGDDAAAPKDASTSPSAAPGPPSANH